MSSATETDRLLKLVHDELLNIPIEKWGYFFPCWVAIWRFIDERWPGSLGEIKARYHAEPEFEGHAAEWFCGTLGNNERVLDELEAIMYPVSKQVAQAAVARGFVTSIDELPPIHRQHIEKLVSLIGEEVARGFESGQLHA